MTVAAGVPIFCFVVFMEVSMTVVKSISDGLRDRDCVVTTVSVLAKTESQPAISAGPRQIRWICHLRRLRWKA